VNLSRQLEVIDEYAFYDCRSLYQVNLPPDLISIGDEAFRGCERWQEVDLPLNLVSLGKLAFGRCVKLRKVAFGQRVVWIGTWAFWRCESLVAIDLSATCCRVIDAEAFSQCTRLLHVSLSAALEHVGEHAFRETSMIRIDMAHCERLQSVKRGAFADVKSLRRLTLPDHHVSFGDYFVDGSSFWILDVNERVLEGSRRLNSLRLIGLDFVGSESMKTTMTYGECASFGSRPSRPRRPDG
jgi:hypothetical protein